MENKEKYNPASLEKTLIHSCLGRIEKTNLELFKEELTQLELEASNMGYFDLTISPYVESDYLDGDSFSGVKLFGWQLESDEKYVNRLCRLRDACTRNLENVERMFATKDKTLARINEINGVIEKNLINLVVY